MVKYLQSAFRQLLKQPGFAFIDAETSVDGVRRDLSVASHTCGDSEGINGTINGGGKSVHLRSGAGSISIKSRDDSAQTDSCKKGALDG
jgi:hypothetical protein